MALNYLLEQEYSILFNEGNFTPLQHQWKTKNSVSQPIIAIPYCCELNTFVTPVYQKSKQWIFMVNLESARHYAIHLKLFLLKDIAYFNFLKVT